jgi:2-polyprenyl-3-methyl-5-hydroxy-6-metoxy-1,4-benzoquinol methylase
VSLLGQGRPNDRPARRMTRPVLPLGPKPDDYFTNARADLIERLPRPLGRVLDVGCGAGHVGRGLRAAGASELVGIELNRSAAATARSVFDRVIEEDAEVALAGLAEQTFDTICCYDILEHLYDPGSVIDNLRRVVTPGGHLHISIPNARHFSLLLDLVVHGTFGYSEHGHRDATHIRWFTRRDAEALVRERGWQVEGVETHPFKPGRAALTRLTGGYASEYFAVQWFLLCRP